MVLLSGADVNVHASSQREERGLFVKVANRRTTRNMTIVQSALRKECQLQLDNLRLEIYDVLAIVFSAVRGQLAECGHHNKHRERERVS
jgi:hypothetical protein